MKTELHHTIPVSLGGPSSYESLMELEVQDHRDTLHRTLDIPSNVFSKMIRKYRELYGDKIIIPPDAIEYMGDMQKRFFDEVYKLPRWMQEEHIRVMSKLVATESEKYRQLTGDHFDTPKKKHILDEQVHSLHSTYLDCRKEIAREVIKIVKNNLK